MILVTGGAGFIGSHVVDRLLSEGHSVVCVDNLDPYYSVERKKKNISKHLEDDNYKFVECDIRSNGPLTKVFNENRISNVIHLAAKAGVRSSIKYPMEYVDTNVRGTLNLLELSVNNDVENFIFGSSSSVYGVDSEVPFKESSKTKPISPYAASKASGESLCQTYSHLYELPVTCLRFFTVYGPRGRPDMAVYKFTKLISEGKEIPMYGDGSSRRDYTFVADIVKGVMAALDRKYDFEIFNLGNSRTVELRRLIEVIKGHVGKDAKIKRMPMQPGDVPITYADISKSKGMLGYEPEVRIEEGIKRFVDWYEGS